MEHQCRDNEELLSRLVDSELSGDDRRRVAAHVLICPECSGRVGRLVATKRLLERSEAEAEVPANFMQRARWRLDGIEGRHSRGRTAWLQSGTARAVAMAAMGLVVITAALMVSSRVNPVAGNVDLLVAAHNHMSPAYVAPTGYCTVGAGTSMSSWRVMRRALLQVSGQIITHTIYEVGSCPLSVFEGPSTWDPISGGDRVRGATGGTRVGAIEGVALSTWEQNGRRYVVMARASIEDVAELARQLQTSPSRSPSL